MTAMPAKADCAMNAFESKQHDPEPTIHWLVRGVMWLLVASCVALPLFAAVALFVLHAAGSAPRMTAWAALQLAGVVCGCCVFGAGFLGTLAWRGHSEIKGVVWRGRRALAPRLPWHVRAWTGIVCLGMLMLLTAQLHSTVMGAASWLSAVTVLVTVAVTFWNLTAPLLGGRWSEATVRLAAHFAMTPREIHAAVKSENARRHGI